MGELAEKEKMKSKVNKILNHNINVFINRQLIYNYPEQLFADAGVMAIEHADFEGVERLALVTGGEIVSTFYNPEMVKLGTCKLIEEIMIGEKKPWLSNRTLKPFGRYQPLSPIMLVTTQQSWC